MSPHVRTRRIFLILLFAATPVATAAPPEQPGGDEAVPLPDITPRWRVVARWYGTFKHDTERFARNEAGDFGQAPHSRQASSGSLVLREDVDDVTGNNRTVVERFNWASTVSDLYYFNHRTGARTPAGPGGSGGGSHGEAELTKPGAATADVIDGARRDFENAKAEYERAARGKRDAERALAKANGNNDNADNRPNRPAPTTQLAAGGLRRCPRR